MRLVAKTVLSATTAVHGSMRNAKKLSQKDMRILISAKSGYMCGS